MGGFNINLPDIDTEYLLDFLDELENTGGDTEAAKKKAEEEAAAREAADREEADRRRKEEEERIAREEREAQIEAENAAARKAEQDRLRREEDERFAREEAERQRLAREKAERDRLAAEKAERDRLAREKAERDRIAAEKAEADRVAAEKAAAEKAEADRIAAEKAEADRIAAEKAEADRLAAEQAKKDKARDDYYALLRDTGPMTDEKRAELDELEAIFRPVRTFTDQELADMAAARAEFGAWYQVYGGPEGGSSFLGDLLGPVTDAISGTAEFLIGNIVKPVAQVYGDVAAATAEDPVTAIAKGIALATGNAWAIPLIDGADVAADGGSIGDILQATATSYVAGKVGSMAGQAAGSAIAESTGSELAGQIIGAGTGNAAAAVVLGQDPMDAFIRGGVGAATGAMMGKLQEGGHFDGLPPRLQAAAQQSLSASLGAILTGQDVTPELITGALVRSQITMDTVRGLTEGRDLSDGAIAALTNAMTGTLTAALTGGDPSDALMRAISQYGAQEFANAIDPTVNNALDRVSGAYAKAQEEAAAVDALVNKAYNARDRITAVDEKVQAWANAKDVLEKKYNDAFDAYNKNPNDDTWDAVTAASRALTSYTERFNQRYATVFKPQYDGALADLKAAQEAIPAAEESYAEAISNLRSDADAFGDNLKPIYSAADRAVVRAMAPDFDPDFYAATNDVPEGEDPYKHWIENGRQQNLITNAKQYANELNRARAEKVAEALETVDYALSNLTPDQISGVINSVNRKFGDSLEAIQNADLSEIASTALASIAAPSDYYDKDSQRFATVTPEIRDRLLAQGIDAKVGKQLTADQAFSLIKQDSFDYYAKNPVAREEGVTDEDIVSGKARLIFDPDSNTQKWSNTALASTPHWDEDYGTVIRTDQVAGGGFVVVDHLTGEALSEPYRVDIRRVGSSLDELRYENPTAYVASVGAMASAAAAGLGEVVNGESIYNLAKSAVDRASETGSTGLINTVATVLSGVGGILGDINAVTMLAGIDPESTALGEFATKLEALGNDAYTEDFQKAFADIDKQIGDATGFMETAQAIFGAFTEHPTEFLTKYVGTELVQEALPLLLSGGVAGMVKGAGKLAKAGAEVTEKFAQNAGLSAAAASDIAEAFGGSAQGAYDTAYAEARDAGYSEEDAAAYAYDTAMGTGTVAAVAALASMGIGGNALEKAILGNRATGKNKDMLDAFADRVKTGGAITLREGVTEAGEEGITQAYLEGALYELNPNRDVSGEIAAAAMLGAISGGTVAGTIYGGTESTSVLANALTRYNSQVSNTLNAVREGRLDAAAATDVLGGFNITGAAQTDLLNMVDDQNYTSTGEVAEVFAGTPYEPSAAELNQFVGNVADSDLAARINDYIDPLYFDSSEVIAAARDAGIGLTAEQVQSYVGQRDEQEAIDAINAYADSVLNKQEDDAEEVESNIPDDTDTAQPNPANELARAILDVSTGDAPFNPFYDLNNDGKVTAADARLAAELSASEVATINQNAANYTPPADDADADNDGLDDGLDQDDDNDGVVDPADPDDDGDGTTDATDPDTVDTTDSTDSTDSTDTGANDPYFDSAEKFYADKLAEGLSPEDAAAEVRRRYGALSPKQFTDITGQQQDLGDAGRDSEVDTTPTIPDGGQDDEDEVDTDTDAGPAPTARDARQRFNELYSSYIDAGMSPEGALLRARDNAKSEFPDFAGNLNRYYDNQYAKIVESTDTDTDDTETTEPLDDTGPEDTDPVDVDLDAADTVTQPEFDSEDLTSMQDAIFEQLAANEAAGMARDEALAAAIETVASNLNITETNLLNAIGETETSLLDELSEVESRLGGTISDTKDDLIELILANEEAGMSRDDALAAAIEELAGDVDANQDELLSLMRTSEENLLDELSGVEERLAKEISDTESSLIKLIGEKEKAGMERDAAIQEAVSELATELGLTEENLLTELGLTEERLAEDITALETRIGEVETGLSEDIAETEATLLEVIAANEAAGMSRDEAIAAAVDAVSFDLELTREELLDSLGLTEENILAELGAVEARIGEDVAAVGADVDAVAALVGKPARDVTQADIDFVADLIAQQEALTDPTTFTLTEEQIGFDVTGDGVIDINDQILLENALAGQEVAFAPTSVFTTEPTGLYGTVAETETALQEEINQAKEETMDLVTKVQTEIGQQMEEEARRGAGRDFLGMLLQAPDLSGRRVDVTTPGPIDIGQQYDFSSIFRTPQQEAFYQTPYAEGGTVMDVSDEILRILGDKR